MTGGDWRRVYTELADLYYRATGAFAPPPVNPRTGKQARAIIIHPDRLRKMYVDQHLTLEQIAEVLSCSPSGVHNLLLRAGIPLRKQLLPQPSRSHRGGTGIGRGQRMRDRRRSAGWEFGGHERQQENGYIVVYCPEHPRANKAGYVPKHTLVMERVLGRYLESHEVVHHINRIRDDNRPENLQLMDREEHSRMHGRRGAPPCAASTPPRSRPAISAERVKQLYDAGLTDGDIAIRLGCATTTVLNYRRRMELPAQKRSYKKIDDAAAMEMYQRGASNGEIAANFGVTKHAVSAWRRTHGLPAGQNTSRKEQGK